MAKNQDFAEYLAAEFVDNRFYEDMTIDEFLDMELTLSDVVSRDSILADYDSIEECIADLKPEIEKAYNEAMKASK